MSLSTVADTMADIVVGSGPAGVAATRALLARGRRVILLDGGKTLEDDRRAVRDRLAAGTPDSWDPAGRRAYIDAQRSGPPGQVRRFGSGYAMELADATFADPGPVALRASRAVGGLSNLWGTAVLPFVDSDMHGWPITAADLAPHYRAVLDFLPVSGRSDALAGRFAAGLPDDAAPVPSSVQAARLLDRLDRAAPDLAGLGIVAGMARQAVAPGCQRCGLCLAGCPWRLMWSAAREVEALARHPQVDYRPGSVVAAVSDGPDGATCHLAGGETLTGGRVLLAAGVLETARILLASGPAGRELTLREARHAFLPALERWPHLRRPDRGPLTTLPQAFIELDDRSVSPFLVHGQVYTWNDEYARDLTASYGRRLPGSGPLWPWLARRLVVTQIFLHSDHWPGIRLGRAADGRLVAKVTGDSDAGPVMAAAAHRFARALGRGGLSALTFALRHDAPGASFHVGSSLPMAERPADGQSDLLGRPRGAGRVHVVDASVLPAIPATTITFGVMANAHRIASLIPD